MSIALPKFALVALPFGARWARNIHSSSRSAEVPYKQLTKRCKRFPENDPAQLSICLSSKPVDENLACWRPLSATRFGSHSSYCVYEAPFLNLEVEQTRLGLRHETHRIYCGSYICTRHRLWPPPRPFAIASATWHAVRRPCWVAVGRESRSVVCRCGQRERGSKKGPRTSEVSYMYLPNLPLKKRSVTVQACDFITEKN